MKVSDCTLIKPLFCGLGDKVVGVARKLRDAKQRRVVVVDGKGFPVGIVSTTDINNRVVAEGMDAAALKACDIMTSPLFLVCDMNDEVNDVFRRMVEHESFFCPVVKSKRLHAVLTYGELLRAVQQVMRDAKGKA
ncbi:CBS domain-containing protein [Candidatus Woesearchaeota archaeon]|nr:CBS domain-containing protein [Candidatus Woesearchaeota archaeon]